MADGNRVHIGGTVKYLFTLTVTEGADCYYHHRSQGWASKSFKMLSILGLSIFFGNFFSGLFVNIGIITFEIC